MVEFDEIFKKESSKMITLSICRAGDITVLEPVIKLIESHDVRCHLIDDRPKLEHLLDSMGQTELLESNLFIHHITDDEEAAHSALRLIAQGKADILVKGMVPTATLLREVLKKEHGVVESTMLSHVALFDPPNYHKALLLSDAAMNIAPDLEQKKQIINNTAEAAQMLGISKPKVALLSAVEKVTDKMPSTVDAHALVEMGTQDFKYDIIMEGPLQYDLAISKKAASQKDVQSEVAGDADILIAPNIEAGNILYKSLVYSAGARVASVLTGARVPIVLTSRADSSEDRFNSINLAMALSK